MSIIGNTISAALAGAKVGATFEGVGAVPGALIGGAIGLGGTALEEYYQPTIQKAALTHAGMTPQTAIGKLEAPQPSEQDYSGNVNDYYTSGQAVKTSQQAYEQSGSLFPYQLQSEQARAAESQTQANIASEQLLQHQIKTEVDRINKTYTEDMNKLGVSNAKADLLLKNAKAALAKSDTALNYAEKEKIVAQSLGIKIDNTNKPIINRLINDYQQQKIHQTAGDPRTMISKVLSHEFNLRKDLKALGKWLVD